MAAAGLLPPAPALAAQARLPSAGAVPRLDRPAAQSPVYTVRPGDTLSGIALRLCGTAAAWPRLYEAARAQIGPHAWLILPGQVIPAACHGPAANVPGAAPAAAPGDGGGGRDSSPPVPAAAPVPAPAALPVSGDAAPGSFRACVIARESGGDPSAVNPSSGAGGLYQFLPSTWQDPPPAGLGLPGLPQDASVAVQDAAFQRAYAMWGTSPWQPSDGCA